MPDTKVVAENLKKYNLCHVKATRKPESIGKDFNVDGYNIEKLDIVDTHNITPEHAADFNSHSHNSLKRYYEVPEGGVIAKEAKKK